MMHGLKEFIDTVDTPGGHILICVSLGLIGVAISFKNPEAAKPLLSFFALAAYAMRGTVKANGVAVTSIPVSIEPIKTIDPK